MSELACGWWHFGGGFWQELLLIAKAECDMSGMDRDSFKNKLRDASEEFYRQFAKKPKLVVFGKEVPDDIRTFIKNYLNVAETSLTPGETLVTITDLQKRLETVDAHNKELREQLHFARKEAEEAHKQVALVLKTKRDMGSHLDIVCQQRDEARKEKEALGQDVAGLKESLDRRRRRLLSQNKAYVQCIKVKEQLGRQLAQTENERDSLRAANLKLMAEVTKLREEVLPRQMSEAYDDFHVENDLGVTVQPWSKVQTMQEEAFVKRLSPGQKGYPTITPGKSCLDLAREAVDDRAGRYGSPEENHGITAEFWTTHLKGRGLLKEGAKLDALDVGWLNILQKDSRDICKPALDNYTDTAGYARNNEVVLAKRPDIRGK